MTNGSYQTASLCFPPVAGQYHTEGGYCAAYIVVDQQNYNPNPTPTFLSFRSLGFSIRSSAIDWRGSCVDNKCQACSDGSEACNRDRYCVNGKWVRKTLTITEWVKYQIITQVSIAAFTGLCFLSAVVYGMVQLVRCITSRGKEMEVISSLP
mmetsp:Transcript_33429/g.105333  ORF Transcript_33429/g.105333 Transcript_33429/m.105333 type:complete len:152 (-) Transcript_33429:22-477(-)